MFVLNYSLLLACTVWQSVLYSSLSSLPRRIWSQGKYLLSDEWTEMDIGKTHSAATHLQAFQIVYMVRREALSEKVKWCLYRIIIPGVAHWPICLIHLYLVHCIYSRGPLSKHKVSNCISKRTELNWYLDVSKWSQRLIFFLESKWDLSPSFFVVRHYSYFCPLQVL